MAEELRLNIVSTADSKGLTKAAQDLKDTKGEADKLGKSFDDLGDNAEDMDQKVSAATKGIRSHAEQIKILRAEYEKTTRTIADLDAQLLGGEGDSKGIRKDLREQRAFLRELERVAKEVKRSSGVNFSLGGGALPAAGLGGMGAIGGVPAPVVAGLVAAVSAAGPAIGAIIGGAVAGATGTVAMAAGIASAAKDSRVQAAARDFGDSISSSFFDNSQAFVEPAIEGLAILKQAFLDLDLNETLAKAAPTVAVIAKGIADFALNLKPGFDKALERIGPFADAAAKGMGDVGDALGDMIDMISSSKGSVDGLNTMFAALGGTIRFIGAELKFLGDRYHEVMFVAQEFTEIGSHTGFSALNEGMKQMTGNSKELTGQIVFLGSAQGQAARESHGFATSIQEIANAINALNPGLDLLFNKLDIKQTQERNAEALFRLRQEVKAHGTDLRNTTEAGILHRQMLLGMVEGYRAEREANIQAGMSADEANAKFRQQVLDLEALAIKLGFSKQGVWDLIGALRNIPSQVNTAIVLDYQTRGVPAGEHSGLRIGELFGARASGGPVVAGEAYMVGEEGPEPFIPATNGYILPHSSLNTAGSSMGMAASTARPLVLNGGGLGDLVFEWLRAEVASRGGTLAVLGLRGN